MDNNALVTVEHLTHRFRIHARASVCAVNDVSFSIRRGEIFGLVGESGSGKSTVAKCVMNVLKPASGRVIYDGIDISDPRMLRRNKDRLHRERQIVFQDSNSALNPRMSVRSILSEPLNIHGMMKDRSAREEFLMEQLSFVGIEPRYLDSRPPELSGGQRQRVSIARALLMNPRLLVADEPVASLDVSIQAQIVNLFKHLQAEHGFTFLFIAHDLAMVEFLCDRVGVMVQGRLVETGRTADVYNRPAHPYTKALLDAMPVPDPRIERARTIRAYGGEGLGENGCWEQTGEDHFVWTEKNG